jgi:hypothetical protein
MRLFGLRTKRTAVIAVVWSIMTVGTAAGQTSTTNPKQPSYWPNAKSPAWTIPNGPFMHYYTYMGDPNLGKYPNMDTSSDPLLEPKNFYTPIYEPHLGPKRVPQESAVCKPLALRIPKAHIGLYNVSENQIGVILSVQKNQETRAPTPYILEAGEFVTVDCEGCTQVTAIIPVGSTPADGDFQIAVTLGQVYMPYYAQDRKRWEISAFSEYLKPGFVFTLK